MILWIDPWIRKLWYALTEWRTVIKVWALVLDKVNPSRQDQFERMHDLYRFFEEIVETYDVQAMGVEKLFFTQYNQRNAEFVYWIRGALMMLWVKHWITLYEWTPKEIKKRVTWNWNAWKALVQTMIKKLFKLEELPKPHDAADALGLCRMVHSVYKE